MKVVIAGTDTEIGKTWFASRVIETLRTAGVRVAARKVAQSFTRDDLGCTDAELLAAATGEDPTTVCPEAHWYSLAMAPPMAASRLGRAPFTIADLVASIAPSAADVMLIESAGGVRSPLADDGDTVALCRALRPDLVAIVADARLGCINAVRLATDVLREHHTVVALNRFEAADELHHANLEWLRARDGLDIVSDAEAVARRIETAFRGLRS
jgi:dethiobiotin synthetase